MTIYSRIYSYSNWFIGPVYEVYYMDYYVKDSWRQSIV